MQANVASKETFFAPDSERTDAISAFISEHSGHLSESREPTYYLCGADASDQVEIPHEVYDVLVKVVHAMREGLAITITPSAHTITTQQAAEILGVTRPTLVKLLDKGKIPYEKPNSHRRVRLADVLSYKEERKEEQYVALSRMGEVDDDNSESTADLMREARKEAARRRRAS